jgi:hypothetical protein
MMASPAAAMASSSPANRSWLSITARTSSMTLSMSMVWLFPLCDKAQ